MPALPRAAACLILCLALAACAAAKPEPSVPSGARPGTAGQDRTSPRPPEAPRAPGLVKVAPAGCSSLSRKLARTLRFRQGVERMRKALRASLEHARSQPKDRIAVKAVSATWKDLAATLEKLDKLLPFLAQRPGLLCSRFSWYRLDPNPELTAYYTPLVRASAEKTPAHPYPVYAKPPDTAEAEPLPDRAAIDFKGALQGLSLELAWVGDRLELFDMHVQGSGVLLFPDGTRRVAVFAGSNKRPFNGLGRMLLDGGHLSPESLSWKDVRVFFANHPEKMESILSGNQSYVFFALRDQGPYGSMGKPLTPMVSLATDRDFVPFGAALVLAGARIVDSDGSEKLDMLGLAQDAGSAITGSRIDLYAGEGLEAAYTARRLKQPVRAYLLLSRGKDHP